MAAAGGHHLLMVGPPGAGKSMLAQRLPSILPPMDAREMLEVSMVASLAGELTDGKLSRRRPFRSPHHSAACRRWSAAACAPSPARWRWPITACCSSTNCRNSSRACSKVLRQPLETGETVVARANYHVTYPARFQLVAAMNPCKCGMAGEPGHVCRKGPRCASDYQGRMSGPLIDRLDIQIELPAVRIADLTLPAPKEASAEVALRVAAARARQKQRFEKLGMAHLTHQCAGRWRGARRDRPPDDAGLKLLREAADAMSLSARGYHRVLRVARTLADLDGREQIARLHIAEALSYRQKLAAFQVAA